MVKDYNTSKNPAMHNFQTYDHKKLDIPRIIMQKIGSYLMHFSIRYEFSKLA
jgi:hypothetical protein